MFLPDLDPLLDLLSRSLRPCGRFVAHEYVPWETFALHPHGDAISRFEAAVLDSFRAAGGQPSVNRRLPTLLADRGFRIDALRPLPVVGRAGDAWARWLERFVRIYGRELISWGRFWVGPTVTVLDLHASAPE
jgi:hypothetical protein